MTKEPDDHLSGHLEEMEENLKRRLDLFEERLSRKIQEVHRSAKWMIRAILIALAVVSVILLVVIPLANYLIT